MKPKMIEIATGVMMFTLSMCDCQAQIPACRAANFDIYGNYQKEEVLLHFIGINGSAYSGNPLAYFFTALNFPNGSPYIGAVVAQVVAVDGVPQDGPGTFLAPSSQQFQAVLNEALIWGAMDYWYFQFGGQSQMNTEQNWFQQIYQGEWWQEVGVTLATFVNYATILGPIMDDWPSSDSEGADQIGDFAAVIQDTISGYSQLLTAFSSSAPNILNVLQKYNVVTDQNYTSA